MHPCKIPFFFFIYSWSFLSNQGLLFPMAPPEGVGRQLLRVGKFISPLSCPAGSWSSVLPSSPACSCSSLTPSAGAGWGGEPKGWRAKEERREFILWYFGKLESRKKLKNVTWGQNVWLSSYRAERGRFIPIATLWPVSCRNFPTSWMCGGFRATSPSLLCFLQLCGRKVIREESAALQETCLRWSCVWTCLGLTSGTSWAYNSSCHCPSQLSFHALIPAESFPPTVNLAAVSFIPAAEFEKENFKKAASHWKQMLPLS